MFSTGSVSNRSQWLYFFFCSESAGIWTNLSWSCSSSGGSAEWFTCGLFWLHLLYRFSREHHKWFPYAIFIHQLSLQPCGEGNYDSLHESLLSFPFFSIFVIDLWSGDSKISTDSFRLICLPLLCKRWVNKTGSSRNSEASFPTCAYWNYCYIWEKKGSTWCRFSFAYRRELTLQPLSMLQRALFYQKWWSL